MNEVIEQAINYIKSFFKNDCSGHDVFHTMRVYKMATHIAEQENADVFIVQLAALLHDVDDRKLSPITCNNKKNAVDFMQSQGMNDDIINRVLMIIEEVSFKGTGTARPASIEGECVQDADRLDAIGAIGIARAFTYGGNHNRIMHDPAIEPSLNMDEKQYSAHISTTINHFYEKLFLLKDLMCTQTAKELAEHREMYMRAYMEEFMSEWEGLK